MKKVLIEHRKNAKGEFVSWQYKFEGASINGKRKWISKAGFATEEEAYTEGMKQLLSYMNGGQITNPSDLSMVDFFDLWMEKYCSTNLKTTTITGYRKKIKNLIIPYIGKYQLKSIRTDALQAIIDDLFQKGYSRNTISGVKGILSKSFRWAKKNRYIDNNPTLEIDMPLPTATPKKGTTRSHVRQYLSKNIINSMFARFPENHTCHIPLILGYRCGLRLGEAYGLTWEDISFKNRTLSVNRQIQYDESTNELFVSPPKYNSYRTIPIDNETLELLKRTKESQKEYKNFYGSRWTQQFIDDKQYINESGNGTEIHFVNIRENGTQIRPRTMQHVGRIMSLKLNHPQFDFHSLRHTHCADLFDAGIAPNVVKEMMGHKNIQTTMNVYDHITEQRKSQTEDIVANMYSNKEK